MAKPTPVHVQDQITQLYQSGLSITTIYKQIGVSQPTISKILKRHNIEIRTDNGQSLDIDWVQVNIEYDAGASTYDLAKEYGCHDETIRRNIINLRSPSERNQRSEESKEKIAQSCKELWNCDEYRNKQQSGVQQWVESGEATKSAKKYYPHTLGKWIKENTGTGIIATRAREVWNNTSENDKVNHAAAISVRNAILNESTIKQRSEEYLARCAEIHQNKYDYSNTKYINVYTKIEIICPEHGPFWQKPGVHLKGCGCPRCGDASLDTVEFVRRSQEIHGDLFDYAETQYTTRKSHLTIECVEHGRFSQIANGHLNGNGCPECAKIVSGPQRRVEGFLPSGVNFIHNDREALNGLEIDIYCPDHKFGIEVHGCYWHSCRIDNPERHVAHKKLHALKAKTAEEHGITLYQFWDYEIAQNPTLIRSMINHRLGRSKRVYARKCVIVELPDTVVKPFFTSSHLQGHRSASVAYACVLDDEIQCTVSFSRHNKHQWEIIRYACTTDTTVIGGFARLLKQFIIDYNPDTILTFADRRLSIGQLYSHTGFAHLSDTDPNYFYHRGSQILSRQRCQKHKLPRLLGDEFQPELSEFQNMLSCGWGRIYDAGHRKMLWIKPS